jgi:hypothetical protein
MALVYLVNKPHVLGRIPTWFSLFFKYDFKIMYKPGRIHVIVDALLRLPDSTKPIGVPNQTTIAILFYTRPKWLNDVKEFLKIG